MSRKAKIAFVVLGSTIGATLIAGTCVAFAHDYTVQDFIASEAVEIESEELYVPPDEGRDDSSISFESADAEYKPAFVPECNPNASSENAQEEPPSDGHQADYIYIGGYAIPYVSDYLASTAPASGAGLWLGSDSTTDGSWGYFIGHNPGPFNVVAGLESGNAVTISDSNGNERTYTVFSVFDVPRTTSWQDVEPYVEGHGESIALQTCVGEKGYRIVLAD